MYRLACNGVHNPSVGGDDRRRVCCRVRSGDYVQRSGLLDSWRAMRVALNKRLCSRTTRHRNSVFVQWLWCRRFRCFNVVWTRQQFVCFLPVDVVFNERTWVNGLNGLQRVDAVRSLWSRGMTVRWRYGVGCVGVDQREGVGDQRWGSEAFQHVDTSMRHPNESGWSMTIDVNSGRLS